MAQRIIATEGCRAALILLAVLHLCFFPCLWGSTSLLESAQDCPSIFLSWSGLRVLDPAAAGLASEPYLALTGEELFQKKTFPLWNPYQGYGAPLLGNMQSQPFYPLTLAFSIHPGPRSYSWMLVLRLYIAGICAYFFLRLFVSFIPSLTGAIMSMLAGYYLLYIPAPHMSVDVLLPAALLTTEWLLLKQAYERWLGFSLVVFLLMIGGMPESTFVLLAMTYLYVVFRISTDPELRLAWRRAARYFVSGTVAGISLAAFVLLPFWEYLSRSFNGHERSSVGLIVGTLHDPLDSSILTYLFPLLYGPPPTVRFNLDVTGIRNFTGLLALFLMLVAVLNLASNWGKRNRTLNALTVFFSSLVLLAILKQYGWTPVNWIGRLPVLSLVHFPKYDEPILSISVSIVSAIGLEKLIRGEVRTFARTTALFLAFLLIPLAAFLSETSLPNRVSEIPVPEKYRLVAIGVPLCLLTLLIIVLIVLRREAATDAARKLADRRLGIWICLLVTAEATLNFIFPMYYRVSPPPLRSKNPYAGAPYIDFLKAKASDEYRVFARDGILTPDWASAFQLYDIRDVDALYPREYLTFVRNFLGGPSKESFPDLIDKFTGLDKYPLDTTLQRRLLQLSSVKYVGTAHAFADITPGASGTEAPFRLVYDYQAKIYEYDDVLPRATIFYQADIQPNDACVLNKLRDPALDIMKTVVVAEPDLDQHETTELAAMSKGDVKRVEPAKIISYKPQSVEIDASADRNAILVLNDTAYPGWTVNVDGRSGKWLKVNYMFRGVLLTPGRHRVRFAYQPLSFYLGACISVATIFLIGAGGWFSRSRSASTESGIEASKPVVARRRSRTHPDPIAG